MSVKTERIEFVNRAGHRLSARLEVPYGEIAGYAIFAHCFTCSKDLKPIRRISRELAQEGIAVLRFDFTGLGESQGDFAETNFTSNVQDLISAAEFLREHYQAPRILIGHSLGGTAVLVAAARIEEVRVVATIAAPSDTEHLRDILIEKAPELRDQETAEIHFGGQRVKIHRDLLTDLSEQSIHEELARFNKALIVFHSPLDRTVGMEHARRIFEAATHPKSFVSLDGADHLLLNNEEDSRFVGRTIANWAHRYLDASAKRLTEAPKPASGEVVVRSEKSGFIHHIRTGRHTLIADEPEEAGGSDSGPAPYDFVLMGLGACTGMTLRMYADRKKWPIERVTVRLSHTKISAEDCEDCRTEDGTVDQIERVLEIEGDLSREQLDRLVEIADRCPVSRTLQSEIKIRTRIADPRPRQR